ncbi:GNAT family N-acetyltransferase [Streptomyces sp. G44]|uniref:GNAT family N-acetyltransferase n=1 Tax=Streptomyces sp. G44 TaxID=2807632 RepID=UPI001EF81A3C|nr:GNAT family N-acetyltransferase [Streptomyces sp. G44]
MPELAPPTGLVHHSYIAAMEEFRAEGRGGPDDDTTLGATLGEYGEKWHDPAVFERYVAEVTAAEHPAGRLGVPVTTLWYLDGGDYLGRIAIRHTIGTRFLREYGGHIGYDVRPTARRRGHATAMLRGCLPYAARLGLESVLVTCDTDNTGSRKVIEASGGVFEDERGGKLRYWIRTGLPRV